MKAIVSPVNIVLYTVVSVAGIIFLCILGLLYQNDYPGLTESITDPDDPKATANACFTAAIIYAGILLFMLCQGWVYKRNVRNEISL